MLLYYYYMDKADLDGAGAVLAAMEKGKPKTGQQPLPGPLLDGAYFAAGYGSVERARAMLEQGLGRGAHRHTELRAEAAVLCAEGKFADALSCAREGMQRGDACSDTGFAVLEHEMFQELINKAENGLRATT